MDLAAAAAAGIHATRKSLLWAGWSSRRTADVGRGDPAPAASGLNDYATFRERADASGRCTGARDPERLASRRARRRAGYLFDPLDSSLCEAGRSSPM